MRILSYIKRYWKSLIVVAVVFYLSLMRQPSASKLVVFEGIDKVVHFFMYFVLSSVLWIEHLIKHKGSYKVWHILWGAILMPVLLGGMMEIAQGVLTVDRACELMDFIANASGVLSASLCFVVFLKLSGRK